MTATAIQTIASQIGYSGIAEEIATGSIEELQELAALHPSGELHDAVVAELTARGVVASR